MDKDKGKDMSNKKTKKRTNKETRLEHVRDSLSRGTVVFHVWKERQVNKTAI
jgi:hypothetical protein